MAPARADGTEKLDKKKLSREEKVKLAEELTKQMKEAAKILNFERAAYLRDKIASLRIK